jgi:hypothetical protein
MNKIFETEMYKNLIEKPKPITIQYMQTFGPIITNENINELLEQLMIDYLIKKDLIIQHYKKYNPKRTDVEQLNIFEKELKSRIGKQQLKMNFLQINPTHDIYEQFKKIINSNNFEYFLI